MRRREFLPGIFAAAIGTQLPLPALGKGMGMAPTLPPPESPRFWEEIRALFRTGDIINLNNGAVSPHPLPVEEAFFNYHRIANETPSLHLRRSWEKQREIVREKLAGVAGCPAEEIAVNRNTTEALVTIIMGLPLKRGDEVVLSVFDYPSMMNAWKIRERRDGIRLRRVNPEAAGPNNASVADAYVSQFNKKTRVLHLTHMINWTGRLVPAQEIVAAARERGIITVVDAAHSFAHIPFRVDELNCDYLGVSLHKWLCAPFGTGLLYAKKENVARIPSLYPTEPELYGNIRKFEELGTHNFASEAAISEAVDFHHHIGAQRKYARLMELRDHWVNRVKQHPKIKINTPLAADMSGVMALVEVEGKSVQEVNAALMHHRLHGIPVTHENVSGIRISPHVYTTKEELDVLVDVLLEQAG